MSKRGKIALISGILIFMFGLIYIFGLSRDDSYVTDNWIETYAPADKGPYGTYVMKELLDTVGLFGTFIELETDIDESLEDVEDENDIYFFIGKTNHLSESSVDDLVDFVYNGNTAFIAAKELPELLSDYFFLDNRQLYETENDSIQYFEFEHSKLNNEKHKFDFIYNNKREVEEWRYYKENNFDLWDDSEASVLGRNSNGKVNFLKITYGEGTFYFHSNPYAFTNVCMLREDGFTYAEKMLQHIPPGTVQWDKYNIDYHYSNSDNENGSGDGNESRRSMLEFIFKNKPLTWAFVILVVAALLFALFKGKRMQNIVKPAESKENTSLRYIETLSSLYLQEKQHIKLIRLKQKTFLNFLGEHYYMSTTKIDSKFIDKLAEKSQVKKDRIQDIFNLFNELSNLHTVDDDMLIELHRRIEYFYKTCK